MSRVVSFDFTDAPPAQSGGGTSDHVPPGDYLLRVDKIDDGTSKNGKRMITATFRINDGDYIGKKLIERFVLESENGKTPFGLQRLHAFLLSLNLPVQQKAVKVDLDKLEGLTFSGEVQDDVLAASGDYAARTISKISQFKFSDAPKAAVKAAPAKQAAPATAPAPAPAAAPEAPVAQETDLAAVAAEFDDLFGN